MPERLLLKILYNDELQFFNSGEKDNFTVGSSEYLDDVYLPSPILSSKHLLFKRRGNRWYVTNKSGADNVVLRRMRLKPDRSRRVPVGAPMEISDRKLGESVVLAAIKNVKTPRSMAFQNKVAGHANASLQLTGKNEFFIGRAPDCDIVVNNPQVDNHNAKIIFDGFDYYIEDLKSSNGTAVNDILVKRQKLNNYDIISVPTAVYMFLKNRLVYATSANGIDIDAVHIQKVVRDHATHRPLTLVDDVNLSIKAGEFVAVVGGSGAGKSTFVDCINARRPATSGGVYYDLNDFYENLHTYQSVIGYVPQRDIMHENLTVKKALAYYAAIRMRNKLDKREINALCEKAIAEVALTDKRNVKISSLSGGQKKRVSIAMELLAEPKVIFLDEPTSGLSPDLDYEIMSLLQDLSKNQGRTIVVITHNMENVDKCDKIAFLGKGGRLCYYGPPNKVFRYFGLNKYSLIFALLGSEEKSREYAERFAGSADQQALLESFERLYNTEEK